MNKAKIRFVSIHEVDLKKLREKKGISLRLLEYLSGVNFTCIHRYENGVLVMSEKIAEKLFKAIDNYEQTNKPQKRHSILS